MAKHAECERKYGANYCRTHSRPCGKLSETEYLEAATVLGTPAHFNGKVSYYTTVQQAYDFLARFRVLSDRGVAQMSTNATNLCNLFPVFRDVESLTRKKRRQQLQQGDVERRLKFGEGGRLGGYLDKMVAVVMGRTPLTPQP